MTQTPYTEPFERFATLFAQATEAQPKDPNAMVVASIGADGRPSARVVLLKHVDEKGFVFYTNHHSRKGGELLGQKVAALSFYWPSLDTQVRVEGDVEVVTDAEADAYFATRARISQLGAWASLQSQPLDSREILDARLHELERRFPEGTEVPRPPHWSGFRVVPRHIEFWKAGEFRLHDRFVYDREGEGWSLQRLFP